MFKNKTPTIDDIAGYHRVTYQQARQEVSHIRKELYFNVSNFSRDNDFGRLARIQVYRTGVSNSVNN